MIQKQLTAYCDECAIQEPLQSQTLKEAADELKNKQWTTDGNKHWYCHVCSYDRFMAAQEQSK